MPHAIALQQHPTFAAALRACGQEPLLVEGASPLLFLYRRLACGLPVAMLSRPALNDETLAKLPELVKSATLHRTPLIIAPDHPAPGLARLGAVPVMTPATIAELDLTAREDTRLALQHQKWRNRLRHAGRQGLHVTRTPMPSDAGHWLLAADNVQRRARHYRTWPATLTAALARADPCSAPLFTAWKDGERVAGMLFLIHGCGATYHIGHTTPRGKALSAHTLLLWEASCWLAQRDITTLDLGLLDTRTNPGLARFKLGSGATARCLGGTWLWWPPLGRTLAPLARLDARAFAPA